MNRRTIYFILLVTLSTACHKNHSPGMPNPGQTPGGASILGRWNLVSVTTYAYDSAGLRNNGVMTYPGPAGSYFQFNTDGSWVESLVPDTLGNPASSGTYKVTSDTSFVLSNPKAADETCKILNLSASQFLFTHQRPTAFNGTDSGYIKYQISLTK
jgi:hypothetical protein